MEEELLRQILQELQDQSSTSFLDFLQLMAPAFVGLIAGLAGAAVGIYSVRRSGELQLKTLRLTTEADIDKISIERRLEWRRERYLELVNALGEFIASWDETVNSLKRLAAAIFVGSTNEDSYNTIYLNCWEKLESARSSGRLTDARLKIGDLEIGDLVEALAADAENRYLAITADALEAIAEFRKSGEVPSQETGYWRQEHYDQRRDIAKRTHQINEMIEQRISPPTTLENMIS